MNITVPIMEIVNESPVSNGNGCVWCELGINHPEDSSCAGLMSPMAVDGSEIARFGRNEEFILRMAVTEKDRLACWHLVYREYLEHGYTQPQTLEYRYSIHDAVPHTATFLVETDGKVVGTVSVFADSPLGLPADEIYRAELDGLRRAGREVVEIGRLTIAREYMNERAVLMNLFDALSLYARCVRRVNDLVITVNPCHAKFYERMILFDRIGDERSLSSVCDAPAVLLRLDLGLEVQARRWAHGEGPRPDRSLGSHTAYSYGTGLSEERQRVEAMRLAFRNPGKSFLKKYFVCLRPLIQDLSAAQRSFLERCYPGLVS